MGSYKNQRPSYASHETPQYPQRQPESNHINDSWGYNESQDYIYTRFPREPTPPPPPPPPPPQFGNQPNDKYQGKTFNIPGQYSRNYSNVIENHALQEHSHRIK